MCTQGYEWGSQGTACGSQFTPSRRWYPDSAPQAESLSPLSPEPSCQLCSMQFTKYLCPNTAVHVVHSVLGFAPPCGLILELYVAYRCWPDMQGTIIPCISRLEEDRTSNATRSTISRVLLCHLSTTHGAPLKQGPSPKETPSWEKRASESKVFRGVLVRKVILWEVSILPWKTGEMK